MNKSLIALAVILVAGIAAAAAYLIPPEPAPGPALPLTEAPKFNPGAAIEDRVAALEAALTAERDARRTVEDELVALYGELDKLKTGAPPPQKGAVTEDSLAQPKPSRFREESTYEERSQALVDQGMTPERASFILQRESELRFALMQEYWEGRNAEGGEPIKTPDLSVTDATLRAEIGDDDFEKYLRANNRSTSIHVEEVLASSPAAKAGLKPGDEIVRYAGDRVYNSTDLMERALDGEGEVVVEVVRDGTTMEVVMPRGLLGIDFGRRS